MMAGAPDMSNYVSPRSKKGVRYMNPKDERSVTEAMIEAGDDLLPEIDGSLWPDRADVLRRIYEAMRALDPEYVKLREALRKNASIAHAALAQTQSQAQEHE